MRKVQNGRCIANISKKSILANKKRNSIRLKLQPVIRSVHIHMQVSSI